MRTYRRIFVSSLLIVLVAGLVLPLAAQQSENEPLVAVGTMFWTDTEEDVEGSEVILYRMEHGLSMTIATSGLEPGHAYTIWWVIFNAPENCSDGMCSLDDSFLMNDEGEFILDEDGRRQPNPAGREMTQLTALRATGMLAYEDGTAFFQAHLPVGDMTDDVMFGPGLFNPMGAEVHLVVRTHGPAIQEILTEQLFTAWGGCPDPLDRSPCEDIQLSIFTPPPT